MRGALLQAIDVTKRFPFRSGFLLRGGGWVNAVAQVNISLRAGELVGLVGESGCGKSTLAKLLCGLLEPTQGQIQFSEQSLSRLHGESRRSFQRSVQMVFQDSSSSLNPRMRIGHIVAEPLIVHQGARGKQLKERVRQLLVEVGLNPDWVSRYPSTMSGGQRQRIGIARALALDPHLLICDEPVSSLDLSVQAQILSLLTRLQKNRGLGLLFISHNLATVSAIADRILVMKDGAIVEEGSNPQLFQACRHPYTRLLVDLAFRRI